MAERADRTGENHIGFLEDFPVIFPTMVKPLL